MLQNTEIEASLLKTGKLFLFVFGLIMFMLMGVLSSIFLAIKFKSGFSIIIILAGVIFFFILPLVFVNRRMNLFSKKAIIKLTNDFFKIEIINKKTNDIEEQQQYYYRDIKLYQMAESTSNNSSYIKLVLNNGTKVKYSFFEQTKNEENVLKNVQAFFTSYNEDKSINEKISLLPTFYTTKAGKYSIIGLGILLGITILLQVIYKPQTIPFSLLIGTILYFRIKSQQKSDLELYNKLK